MTKRQRRLEGWSYCRWLRRLGDVAPVQPKVPIASTNAVVLAMAANLARYPIRAIPKNGQLFPIPNQHFICA